MKIFVSIAALALLIALLYRALNESGHETMAGLEENEATAAVSSAALDTSALGADRAHAHPSGTGSEGVGPDLPPSTEAERVEGHGKSRGKQVATMVTLSANAVYIPNKAWVNAPGADGRVELREVTRNFTLTKATPGPSSDLTGELAMETSDDRYVKLPADSFYRETYETDERRGKYRIDLSLHPSVSEDPDKGTLVEIDGAHIGFRLLSDIDRTYELVALHIDPEGALAWESLAVVGEPFVPEHEWLRDLRSEFKTIAGTEAADWEAIDLSVTIDYDDFTWAMDGEHGIKSKPQPLLMGSDVPEIVVSNGTQGEAIVVRSSVTALESSSNEPINSSPQIQ